MKNLYLLLLLVTACILITPNVPAQEGSLQGLLSNITKGHSTEAIETLSSLKANLLACLAAHPGNESSCNNFSDFLPSQNFTYDLLQPPQNGSKAWALRASGNSAGGLTLNDQIILTSDDNGNVNCKGTGQLTGVC